MPNTNSSTLNTQNLIDYARVFDWTVPTVGLAGYDDEPALSFAQIIVQQIMNKNDPWKWNSYRFPAFFTSPYQQDFPTSISQNLMGWLEGATIIQQNNNSQPIPQPPIRAVARLQPTSLCGTPSEVCWILNRNAITGLWPGANVAYQNPLASLGGGPGSNPLTAITDTNGNIQVVTTYGVTGNTQPSWPAANTAAGTVTNDGTVRWTVQDPNGVAIRVNAIASNGSVVWQVLPVYQQKPPTISSLSSTFAPIPDDLEYLIKQGFLALCWKKSDKKTFQIEYAQWLADIKDALGASDRETQDFGISPSEPITGGSGLGGYSYPGWQGWSNSGN
jgi:hypothetical protein